MPEASQAEKNMYGADVRLHPITLMPLEYGIGCAPDDVQAQAHCKVIERERGKKIADEYRARLAEAAKNPEAPELTAPRPPPIVRAAQPMRQRLPPMRLLMSQPLPMPQWPN